ncbi:MAG: potassium channel family protein [Gemmatimonadetes bacterium]|nr:potassium channel family protein [Gemmatimonadota bacterium]
MSTDLLLQLAGGLVLLLVAQDVFFTVLFPASGRGLIRKPVSAALWHLFRLLGRMTGGRRRRNVLSYGGPVIIAATMAVWFLLLAVGWAMIYKPALGTAIVSTSGLTDRSWSTALYYSGFALTTLGMGDVVARAGPYRLLTVVESALGFATFSMVITYFLSVYSSLTSRNAFAQALHQRTGNTDDAAELVARLADGGDLPQAREQMRSTADFLRSIYQTHRFYPVLQYFHYRDSFYALPRILLTSLDEATLLRTALDDSRYSRLVTSPEMDGLFDSALTLAHELVPGVEARDPSAAEALAWRERYAAALTRLAEVGLQVPSDPGAGADAYVAMRSEWDHPLHALAESMLYEWTDIEATGEPP